MRSQSISGMSSTEYMLLPLKALPKKENGEAWDEKTGSTKMRLPSICKKYEECPNHTRTSLSTSKQFKSVLTEGISHLGIALLLRLKNNSLATINPLAFGVNVWVR